MILQNMFPDMDIYDLESIILCLDKTLGIEIKNLDNDNYKKWDNAFKDGCFDDELKVPEDMYMVYNGFYFIDKTEENNYLYIGKTINKDQMFKFLLIEKDGKYTLQHETSFIDIGLEAIEI